jgi:hypothetical protein
MTDEPRPVPTDEPQQEPPDHYEPPAAEDVPADDPAGTSPMVAAS